MQMQCSEMRHNKPTQVCIHGLVWTDIVGGGVSSKAHHSPRSVRLSSSHTCTVLSSPAAINNLPRASKASARTGAEMSRFGSLTR